MACRPSRRRHTLRAKKESAINLSSVRSYIQLTKPGIIYGNLLTALGGFMLASRGNVDSGLLAAVLAGISLVIASSCVLNNLIDRNIDKLMKRTSKRGTALGRIQARQAIPYASILGLIGFYILFTYTNTLTFLLGLVGMVFYVIIYGYAKRKSVHGTLVGSISGALPPVAGYTAVSGKIDAAAIMLFAALVTWQMPHFYAIAIFRLKDYKAAGIPVLPAVKSIINTKYQIILYVSAFLVSCLTLSFYGPTGYSYALVLIVLSALWLRLGIKGLSSPNNERWARSMFGFSLIVIHGFSIMLVLDSLLP